MKNKFISPTSFVFFLIAAISCSCETNAIEDAGPCGSRSCGVAMFHDHSVLWEMTRDDCLEKSVFEAEEDVCRQAYDIVSGSGLDAPPAFDGGQTCRSSEDCPVPLGPCQACLNGSNVCPGADCVDGQCVTNFPGCTDATEPVNGNDSGVCQ